MCFQNTVLVKKKTLNLIYFWCWQTNKILLYLLSLPIVAISGICQFKCCWSSLVTFEIIAYWGSIWRLSAHQATGTIQFYSPWPVGWLSCIVAPIRYGAPWNIWDSGRLVLKGTLCLSNSLHATQWMGEAKFYMVHFFIILL